MINFDVTITISIIEIIILQNSNYDAVTTFPIPQTTAQRNFKTFFFPLQFII